MGVLYYFISIISVTLPYDRFLQVSIIQVLISVFSVTISIKMI